MTKFFLHIICLFAFSLSFGQKEAKKPVVQEWKKLNKNIGYEKNEKYKGPKKGDYFSPGTLQNKPSSPYSGGNSGNGSTNSNSTVQPYQGRTYTPRQIQGGKNIPGNPGAKKGTLKRDPNIVQSEPAEFPEEEEEEEEQSQYSQNQSSSNYNSNPVSWDGWKTVGIIALVLLGIFILYLIFSSIKPGEKTIPFAPLEEDMNPETISKTELELRLEEAENNGEYKECVRIYFLFAMKELLNRKLVYWKKEKTNMHYIIEMQGKPGVRSFENIVGQYDIVWYGDYLIDQKAYYAILPTLVQSYKELENLK